MARKARLWREQHEAESAGIIVGDALPALHVKDNVVVGGAPVARMVKGTRRRRVDAKRAAHPQMHDQRLIAFKIRDEIFGPSPQRQNAPVFEAGGEIFRKRKAQIRPSLFDPADFRSGERRREAQSDSLDLGQFGHRGARVCRKDWSTAEDRPIMDGGRP